jgi:hypothetical protein
MTLDSFLKSYRDLIARGDQVKLQRMLMLVELKPLAAVWQTQGPYSSWNGFLAHEQLCPVHYFMYFEKAITLYKRPVIERVGVEVAVVLAKIEDHLRDATLSKVDAYIKAYGRRPTNRMVWTFVRALRLLPLNVVVHGGKHVRTN